MKTFEEKRAELLSKIDPYVREHGVVCEDCQQRMKDAKGCLRPNIKILLPFFRLSMQIFAAISISLPADCIVSLLAFICLLNSFLMIDCMISYLVVSS